jgi:hypothetical protein
MSVAHQTAQVVYWHRDMPPLDADAIGVHTVEATSSRVPQTMARRDELWNRCCAELMAQARTRLEQEVARLGGTYARVLEEFIDVRHDDATGEAWLHGRFDYVLYGRSQQPVTARMEPEHERASVVRDSRNSAGPRDGGL